MAWAEEEGNRMQCRVSQGYKVLLITVYALWSVLSGFAGTSQGAGPALGPCEPGYVRHWQRGLPIRRAAMHGEVAAPETSVPLEWLGHSSFLMTSPDGLRVLIDPSA